jgi:hypothetical protein
MCERSGNLALVAAFLAARGVRFVVVGGVALCLHARDHVPADLDVVPAPSRSNLRGLFDALEALGEVGRTWRPTDHVLATRDLLTRVTPVGSVDVMLRTGRNEYESLERNAISVPVNRRDICVGAVDDVLRLRARYGKGPVGG